MAASPRVVTALDACSSRPRPLCVNGSLKGSPVVASAELVDNCHSLPDGMPTLVVQDSSCYKREELRP